MSLDGERPDSIATYFIMLADGVRIYFILFFCIAYGRSLPLMSAMPKKMHLLIAGRLRRLKRGCEHCYATGNAFSVVATALCVKSNVPSGLTQLSAYEQENTAKYIVTCFQLKT